MWLNSGWEILLKLKQDPRTQDIPVIVVTIVDRPGTGVTPPLAQLRAGLRGNVNGDVAAAHVRRPVVQRQRADQRGLVER